MHIEKAAQGKKVLYLVSTTVPIGNKKVAKFVKFTVHTAS